ncbi:ATP-binding cassette domain-containing protein [Pseudonocardia sp. HH130630-07]|uniref:ATP-binding cassette domain-containing protein n=1 Tax=Pseudonocardia sp. HH130630-07 TaxID=1690815 RepID=UPI0009F348B7|nr:ATP-binding cassette domain-containing protein [Pseudonocardia sp. HH130630-07]
MHDAGPGRIVVDGLGKDFGRVEAVRDLSFTVEPGSVTGFLGPNGSGKTTTLRMILGLVVPSAGRALVDGVPFAALESPGRVVGAVLEVQGVHPKRTARAHLRAAAAAVGVPDARVEEVLALVGLAAAADRAAGGFSLGMNQRLALAAALLGDPRILVLDEPGNGLDPDGIAWLRAFLQAFAASGRSVLVSSHQLAEMELTAQRLVVIDHGRCRFDGAVSELRAGHGARVLVRSAAPERLAQALVAHGLPEVDKVDGPAGAGDGWLAVAGADAVRVGDVALAAGVAVHGMTEERIGLEQMFRQLLAEGDPG